MAPIDPTTRARRAAWIHRGAERPAFATSPGPGQESVWDYPRPPALVRDPRIVEVRAADLLIARADGCLRVLETASPPTVYLHPDSVEWTRLERAPGTSHCEWKGSAVYWDVVVDGGRIEQAGWSYETPHPEFDAIKDHLGFYPGRVACWLGGERVQPQPGGFYGGWVTSEIVGPFKGEKGTGGW